MAMNQTQNGQSVVCYTQPTKKTYGFAVTGVLHGMILSVHAKLRSKRNLPATYVCDLCK